MKERPILFSAPMVRAILEGRKTQTRRVVKGQALDWLNDGFTPGFVADYHNRLCPYGQPGDQLYVREAFSYTHGYGKDDVGCPVWYWADGNPEYGDFTCPKPPIHMPRWASRILLEITAVRVERLQDISEADAKAEGCSVPPIIYPDEPREHYSYVAAYKALWESINGVDSWDANPWVWVVEFKKVGAEQ